MEAVNPFIVNNKQRMIMFVDELSVSYIPARKLFQMKCFLTNVSTEKIQCELKYVIPHSPPPQADRQIYLFDQNKHN